MTKQDDEMVTVYPTEPVGESRVPGVPAVEQEVTQKRAAELLAYQPPAFTLKQPGKADDKETD